ncbi:MAG: hypothetical protein ISS52_02980 [Dehalococcoidia bacterium]|nr:hypothetical protein [Dehalococcoidia bacterium]
MESLTTLFTDYIYPCLPQIVVTLFVVAVLCLFSTIALAVLKKDWMKIPRTIMGIAVSFLLFLGGLGLSAVNENQEPYLVIDATSIRPITTGTNIHDIVVRVDNDGEGGATDCTARAEFAVHQTDYQLSCYLDMPDAINPAGFATVRIVRAQKRGAEWITWPYSVELAGLIKDRITLHSDWALPNHDYTLALTIESGQTPSEVQQFTLIVSPDRPPELSAR